MARSLTREYQASTPWRSHHSPISSIERAADLDGAAPLVAEPGREQPASS